MNMNTGTPIMPKACIIMSGNELPPPLGISSLNNPNPLPQI